MLSEEMTIHAAIMARFKTSCNMPDVSGWKITPMAADGSDRSFFRLTHPAKTGCIAIIPGNNGTNEARSAWRIGCHLNRQKIPAPEMIGYDHDSGTLFCEDLGGTLLHGHLVSQVVPPWHTDFFIPLYTKVIEALVDFQTRGIRAFDQRWCWDTACYDKKVMQQREAGYFYTACCTDLLGISKTALAPTVEETTHLIDQAAQLPVSFLLHRDFQSRNLMLHNDTVKIIDFQGARHGPLGYDLASLLVDPYAGMPQEVQEQLYAIYLTVLQQRAPGLIVEAEAFAHGFFQLCLLRNMQVMGAYAFLGFQRNKPFFRGYLLPAAENLLAILEKTKCHEYVALTRLAATCLEKISRLSTTSL